MLILLVSLLMLFLVKLNCKVNEKIPYLRYMIWLFIFVFLQPNINLKITFMKLLSYISGALFTSLSILGVLFKTLHYPGANALMIFGLAGLAIIFIPSVAIYKYNKD